MSMLAEYYKELDDCDVITKEGVGFATYQFGELQGEKYCYIKEIYVRSEFRKTAVASEMANEITHIAKEKGCAFLLGSVRTDIKASTTNIKVLLAYGFKFMNANEKILFFKKEIL